VPYISYSINRTDAFHQKRGLSQQVFKINFEEEVKGVRFEKETQSFLILFNKKLTVLRKDAKFLKTIILEDLLAD